jgi:hypothetical protein
MRKKSIEEKQYNNHIIIYCMNHAKNNFHIFPNFLNQ